MVSQAAAQLQEAEGVPDSTPTGETEASAAHSIGIAPRAVCIYRGCCCDNWQHSDLFFQKEVTGLGAVISH